MNSSRTPLPRPPLLEAPTRRRACTALAGLALGAALPACAQPGRLARALERAPQLGGVRSLPDLPYGPDARQRMDVYLPADAAPRLRPMIVFVHGGTWMRGDRRTAQRGQAKLSHWVAERGWVFVSLDYRMVPQVSVADQLADVAKGFATAQASARDWGVDPARVVLMGHSAGAHLVALLAANPQQAGGPGVAPWRTTVVLDSAALNVPAVMRRRHARFYDQVFGSDPAFWRRMSPEQVLRPGAAPLLLVCSTQRRDDPCAQARGFAGAAARLGVRTELLPQDLSHAEINQSLGQSGAYTDAVDRFLATAGV